MVENTGPASSIINFGTIEILGDKVLEKPNVDSVFIGRAQGMYIIPRLHLVFSFIFINDEFKS